MEAFVQSFSNELLYPTIVTFLSLYPIWVPLFLGFIFFHVWFDYKRTEFIEKQGSVLLEIKIPKEVTKTPLAMEIFFTSIWQKGSANYLETYLSGKVPPWYSLELVSLGGKVHFYIWTQLKFKDFIESQLYAQYPSVEIVAVEDYATKVPHDPENMPMWGTYYKLGRGDAYPIKTYVDFGLDKASDKEELKTDPMTSVLEWLGSLQNGEQAWIQIIIQAHKKLGLEEGYLSKKDDWIKKCEAEIKKIRAEATPKTDSEYPGFPNPTKGQSEAIAAIERSMHKYPFEVGMRGIYLSTKEANKIAVRIPGLIGAFRQYSANYNYFNEIKIGWFTDLNYPWQDFMRIRRNAMERSMLKAYKMRSFFQPPFKFWHQTRCILTTEELATIFHLPGLVAGTPGLDRIESRKSDAPSNLPI